MSILGAIANPQMADIAGALDVRQKRLDADEARRKEIRMGQLVSEAIPNIREGSPLHEMAQTSPREFAVFAKALGVPLNSGDKLQEVADDVSLLYSTAQSDPYAAVETAQNIKAQRNQAGRETPQLDKWLAKVEEDPQTAFTSLFTMHRAINGDSQGQAKVQSSDILDDGTTIQVLSDGKTRVVDPEGRELEGAERAEAIKAGQEFGVDIQSRRAGGRTSATLDARLDKEPELNERITRARENAEAATGQIKDYFKQLEGINANIANYDQAIKALDEGANTGAVARRFPSVRAASVKLENAINKLGLNVIQNTTFGSLSEAELDFALRSAVPDNLPEDELRQFLVETRDAQAKMADYVDNAIQFLNIPGNTLADLRATNPEGGQQERGEATEQPAQPSGPRFLGFE